MVIPYEALGCTPWGFGVPSAQPPSPAWASNGWPRPPEVGRVLDQLAASRGAALLLFFGSEDPGTGASWCPDCVTADPVLRAACRRERPELTLYECPVGQRSDWKGRADHPYRLHGQVHLNRIPTLLLIEGGCERGRLVEADCARPESVAAFLRPPPVGT